MNFRIITDEGSGYILQKKVILFWVCARWKLNPIFGEPAAIRSKWRFSTVRDAKQWASSMVSESKKIRFRVIEEFHIN